MSRSENTQTDPLIELVAQHDALRVRIDRLMAERGSPPVSSKNRSLSTSAFTPVPASPVRVPALERLGERRRRYERNRSRTSGSDADQSSSEQGDSYNELSVVSPPPPPERNPPVKVVRGRRTAGAVQRQSVSRRGRPPIPTVLEDNTELRDSVFNRLSNRSSVAEVEQRLRSEMKAQLAEILKAVGQVSGGSTEALAGNSISPFAAHIQTCIIPNRFKLPNLESYDGSTDPVDHWQQFGNMMALQNVPDGVVCRSFLTTLKGTARMWVNSLSPGSIQSSQELGTRFIAHFLGTRKQSKPSTHLLTIKQSSNESLKDYSSRFNQESLLVDHLDQGVAVAAFMNGVSSPYCLMTLARMAPRTMSDLMDEVNKQIGVEETLQGRNLSGFSTLLPSSKRQGEHRPFPDQEKGNKKNKENPDKSGPSKAHREFTPLTVPLGEVYAQLEPGAIPKARKMIAPEGHRDTTKYCRYHKDHGHDTDDCWKLKQEIERLIQRGQLRQYVEKKKDAPPKTNGNEHTNEIFMIEGGSSFSGNSNRSRKAHIRQAKHNSSEVEFMSSRPTKIMKHEVIEVTFSDRDMEGVEYPHDDPLVITALLGNHKVHRILVDTGATSNLVYYSAVKAMGFTTEHLTSSSVTLVGFSGEKTRSLGTIKLPITLGTAPQQVTAMAEFLVLDRAPHYNAILGRGTLNEIKAAVATYSLTMRFPTPHGVGEVRGNQVEGRYCHFGALKEIKSVDIATSEPSRPSTEETEVAEEPVNLGTTSADPEGSRDTILE